MELVDTSLPKWNDRVVIEKQRIIKRSELNDYSKKTKQSKKRTSSHSFRRIEDEETEIRGLIPEFTNMNMDEMHSSSESYKHGKYKM